ncbi:hypothetical protein, partial [Streptomyces fuscigenes]|uniref:hypothetical protein n=1 Tax=Streptomyces fuscigenes TaxID=1528880 RepID=UPI003FD75F08|nr:hypothetical protein [Streptomyces fuscigenes]
MLQRPQFVDKFFKDHAPGELRGRDLRNPAERDRTLNEFVNDYVLPWANQARMAEVIYESFDDRIRQGAPSRPAEYTLNPEAPLFRGERRAAAIDALENRRVLMGIRSRVRAGFEHLDLNKAFAAVGRHDAAARAALGRLDAARKAVLSDYAFKVGDSASLGRGLDVYRGHASSALDDIRRVFPSGTRRPAAIESLVAGLKRIEQAGTTLVTGQRLADQATRGDAPTGDRQGLTQWHREEHDGIAIRTLDETAAPDGLLNMGPLTRGEGHVPEGLGSYRPEDWASRADRIPVLLSTSTFRGHTALEQREGSRFTTKPQEVPWHDSSVTFFASHGASNHVELVLGDGRVVRVSGRELGRYLARNAEALGDADKPLVLLSCTTGASPEHGGLSVAQHVANVTGRVVHAPTTPSGTVRDRDGALQHVLFADAQNRPGTWRTFTPEPHGDSLDALARAAGLHEGEGPADPWTSMRTLQYVRTLRGTFGTGIEADTAAHHEALRSLAALDRLRWNPGPDGSSALHTGGRMTPEVLDRITRDVFGLPEDTAPTPEQVGQVLAAAATAHAGDSGATVSDIRAAAGIDEPDTAPATAPARQDGDGGRPAEPPLDDGASAFDPLHDRNGTQGDAATDTVPAPSRTASDEVRPPHTATDGQP